MSARRYNISGFFIVMVALTLIMAAILCIAVAGDKGRDFEVYTGKLDINGEYVWPEAHKVLPATGDYRIVDYGNGTADVTINLTAGNGGMARREARNVPVIWNCALLEGDQTLLHNVDLFDMTHGFFSSISMLENGSGLFSVSFGGYHGEGIIEDPLSIKPWKRSFASLEPVHATNGTIQYDAHMAPLALVRMDTSDGSIYVTPLEKIHERKTVVT